MTIIEALKNMDVIAKHLVTAPPEITAIVYWAVGEVDRQLDAKRNPTMAAMCEAVDAKTMQAIVAENRGSGVAAPSSLAATPRQQEPKRGTGFSEPAPLRSPPGVALLDRMMDVEDARDRADRVINDAMRKQPK
jgi:hypothetical protein